MASDTGWLAFIVIGALAGWLAGKITRGRGFGLIANVIIGILGALIGGYLFGVANIDIGGGFWPSLLTALVGAVILVGVAQLVSGR